MEQELQSMRELYGHLQSRSNEEATEIYRRIRSGGEASSILRFIHDGDLLIQPFLAGAARNQTAQRSIIGLSQREPYLYVFSFLPRSQGGKVAVEVSAGSTERNRELPQGLDEMYEKLSETDAVC